MITLKVTRNALEGSNVRYFYQIYNDDTLVADGLSYLRTSNQSQAEVQSALEAIKQPYVDALNIVNQNPDPLVGMVI